MRRQWRKSDKKINGHRAVENKHTEDTALVGRYGELFEFAPGSYRAIVTSALVANRLTQVLGVYDGYKYQRGEEALLKVIQEQFDIVIKALKLYKQRGRAARKADAFGV